MSEQSSAVVRRIAAPRRAHHPCQHVPRCPAATAPDHASARVVGGYLEQGWSLLCNGVVLFDDAGEIMPDRTVVAPLRATAFPALRAA